MKMLEKFLTLKDAIRKKAIKEADKVYINKLYPNDNKQVKIYSDETGAKITQIFGREEELGFVFAKDEKGVPTFFGGVTEKTLELAGETGAENGARSVHKACTPYSNLAMGLFTQGMTIENFEHLRENDKMYEWIVCQGNYWLGSPYIRSSPGCANFGVSYGCTYGVCNCVLYESPMHYHRRSYGFRPTAQIYLPSEILVDMRQSEETGIWQLIPNKDI